MLISDEDHSFLMEEAKVRTVLDYTDFVYGQKGPNDGNDDESSNGGDKGSDDESSRREDEEEDLEMMSNKD